MIDELVLVRHGETLHNVAGIAQGWNDSPLSPAGERQVARLAERLRAFTPTALYTSPLGRARSTAERIAAEVGLTPKLVEGLREMNYGSWEGRRFLEVREQQKDAFHRWISEPEFPCPDGESHVDVLRRFQDAFRSIETESGGEGSRVVVVTHGTAIRIAATALLNLPLSAARQLAQDNASLNLFIRRGDRYVLKSWNDITHCAGADAS